MVVHRTGLTARETDTRERLIAGLEASNVPSHLHEGLLEYVVCGRPTGHFLEAVLSNDLREACCRVDITHKGCLFDLVFFLYNFAPQGCWGSTENVIAWRNNGGMRGRGLL